MYEIDKMPSAIDIGFTGEKLFREVQINMTKWMEQMPGGVPSIVHIRPGETAADAYIAATTFEDNILTWQITAGDLGEIEGTGLMQVWLEEEENSSVVKRGKSIRIATRISKAINEADGTTPEAQEAWLEQMTALKVATVNAAEDADDAKDDAVAAKTAAETAQGKAEDSAKDAEAYAIGKRNGTDVGSSDPAYHNNSKYYAGEAGTAKTAAEAAQAAAEAAIQHYPYVDTTTGNWMCWDTTTSQWVNTGVHAKGDKGDTGNTGAPGQDGADGTDAYVWIKYSHNQPTQDSDMKATADDWMGVYSGPASSAPTTYTSYTWYKIKGETGQAENVYGSTVPMSPDDSTKVKAAIEAKADLVDSGTAGHFPALDANGNIVDSGYGPSDFVQTGTTLRDVPFSILTSDWTLSNGVYSVEYTTAYATETCKYDLFWNSSLYNSTDDFDVAVKTGGGAFIFSTETIPTGTVDGFIRVIDTDDGQTAYLIQETVIPVTKGGTNANNASGARKNLGLGDAAVCDVVNGCTETDAGTVLDGRQGKVLMDNYNTLNIKIANIGKQLTTSDRIDLTTTNKTVSGISNYKVFVATLSSSWESGVAVGYWVAGTNIIFTGISNTSSGLVMSRLVLSMSGDTITSVGGTLGNSVQGLIYISGVC